jgi:hypothetical protein
MVKEKMRRPVEILWTASRNALYHFALRTQDALPAEDRADFPIHPINLSDWREITSKHDLLAGPHQTDTGIDQRLTPAMLYSNRPSTRTTIDATSAVFSLQETINKLYSTRRV